MDNNNNSRIYKSGNIGSSLRNKDFKSKLKLVLRKYVDFYKGREQFIWIQDCILNYILDGTVINESDVHSLMDHTGLAEGLIKAAYDHVFEELFEAAGENLHDHLDLIKIETGVKFLWDDGETFSVTSDYPTLSEEISRLENSNINGLQSFLKINPKRYKTAFGKL